MWVFVFGRVKFIGVHVVVKDDEMGTVGIAVLVRDVPGTLDARTAVQKTS